MLAHLSKDDILEALGLQTRSAENFIGPLLIGLGAGALLGATVALLVTPRTGSEIRTEIAERGRRIIRRGRDDIEEVAGSNGTRQGIGSESGH